MRTADFNYKLPEELIAQKPFFPRDQCRLMIVKRDSGEIGHGRFFNLIDYLKSGDVLVLNSSKVFKARLYGTLSLRGAQKAFGATKQSRDLTGSPRSLRSLAMTDARVEIFLLKIIKDGIWEALAKPGKKLKIGTRVWFVEKPLTFPLPLGERDRVRGKVWADVVGQADGKYHLKFNLKGEDFWKFLEKYGHVPVPPYVKEEPNKLTDYQTVYANQLGSVAAPTAGFHFTNNLLNKLRRNGVKICYLTLHVGYGTFKPIKTEKIEEHKMESEWVEISKKTAGAINLAKAEGRRVVAVGTTTVRALEGAYNKCKMQKSKCKMTIKNSKLSEYQEEVNLFIKPGFKFSVVDVLITNFHLPKSTLLLLVSAFAGHDLIRQAYREAIKEGYRFYSFGDAMLII